VTRARQAIAVLALVGFFLALYLWLHALGVGGALKCGTGGCEVVQTSRWAVFLGMPVAFYGVVGYALLLIVALVGPPRAAMLLAALATIGVLFTAYLTYIELFVLHAICRWCVGSAAIMLAIWIVALAGVRSPATRIDRAASPPLPDPPA
jgi:uncharacterized membrane protein